MQNKNITLELSIDQFLISHIICIEEHLHSSFQKFQVVQKIMIEVSLGLIYEFMPPLETIKGRQWL